MMQRTFTVRSGYFWRKRTIELSDDFIQLRSTSLKRGNNWKIAIYDIGDVTYHVMNITTTKPVAGLFFTITRKYCLRIKNLEGKEFALNFNSSLEDKTDENIYGEIIAYLWKKFFQRHLESKRLEFKKNGGVTIGRMLVDTKGIFVRDTGLSFRWKELILKESESFFDLNSKSSAVFHLRIPFEQTYARLQFHFIRSLLEPVKGAEIH